MTLDSKILRGHFEHKRLKPTNIRTSQRKVCDLAQLKHILNIGLNVQLKVLLRD